jgi:hypothetical protein
MVLAYAHLAEGCDSAEEMLLIAEDRRYKGLGQAGRDPALQDRRCDAKEVSATRPIMLSVKERQMSLGRSEALIEHSQHVDAGNLFASIELRAAETAADVEHSDEA